MALGQADFDPEDLPDPAVADKLAGAVEIVHRPLPASRLPDAVVAFDRVAESAALGQAVGEGLFAVDIEAGAGGRDGEDGMPVVGHGDRDGVEVAAGIKLPKIRVSRAVFVPILLVNDILRFLEMLLVDIADSHPFDFVLLEERFHVGDALHPKADAGHDDLVAGRNGTLPAEDRRFHDRWKTGHAGDGGGQRFQKIPPAHPG